MGEVVKNERTGDPALELKGDGILVVYDADGRALFQTYFKDGRATVPTIWKEHFSFNYEETLPALEASEGNRIPSTEEG